MAGRTAGHSKRAWSSVSRVGPAACVVAVACWPGRHAAFPQLVLSRPVLFPPLPYSSPCHCLLGVGGPLLIGPGFGVRARALLARVPGRAVCRLLAFKDLAASSESPGVLAAKPPLLPLSPAVWGMLCVAARVGVGPPPFAARAPDGSAPKRQRGLQLHPAGAARSWVARPRRLFPLLFSLVSPLLPRPSFL